MSQNHLSRDEDTVNAWPPVPSFPREVGAQRHPLLQEKRRTMNARRESTPQKPPRMGKKCSEALNQHARGVVAVQLKRGNYATSSGEFTT